MMNLLLVLTAGADRSAFMADAEAAGVTLQPFAGLKRHFSCEWPDRDSFPLLAHPALASCEDGDAPGTGTVQNSFTLASDLAGGNWGLARLARRDAPWNRDRLSHPYDTYYRAVRDGTGVDIYHFDTGIRTTHSEFSSRATNVYEYYSSGGAGDDSGHGTGTASLAAGATAGPARGALIWSFKCLDSAGSGTVTSVVAAIGQALTHYAGRSGTNRPAVASFSLLFYTGSGTGLEAAIADMIDAGVVVVAAAGNDGIDVGAGSTPGRPAVSTDAICVGGMMMNDTPYCTRPNLTNWGTQVDLLAGAYNCQSAWNTGNSATVLFKGTSAACPMAAGVVACMLQGKSRLTTRTQVQNVRQKLIDNATTGRMRTPADLTSVFTTLADRILYLDPDLSTETITGVS